VLEEVERLKRIVDEFSQFARLPKPTLAPLDLSQAITQVMSLYADHGSLRYVRDIAPGVTVVGDRDQLTQVVVNLVKNAEEAMASAGGCVTVRLNADATLEIEDEGPGIPQQMLARLFEPYVTTKPQGTGLGLAIAQRIAHEHDGRLEVENRAPGPGARFRLVLRRAASLT
jgi:nitrogen fixation/metabolism regulation signal transduction histidine kinase